MGKSGWLYRLCCCSWPLARPGCANCSSLCAWIGQRSTEVRLATRIQRAVKADPYPTIFGWHTQRDNELAFMLHLSANGLPLVPAHLAGNFSFHRQVKPLDMPEPIFVPEPELDPQGIYLTFTLSDGDQLMMSTGGWHWKRPRPESA